MESAVRIENRPQLVYLLTEAAELEHGIMCCYLFASFSLKTSVDEGVTEDQLSAIRRWRRLIRGISIEEMLHLGLACNLLTAVGGAPQLRRPNLPFHPRAYPLAFQLRLAPFSIEALDQFIAIEKPLFSESPRTAASLTLPDNVTPNLSDIFTSERDYDTQGKLYRGIEDGFRYLAQKYGEDKLFVGRSQTQATAEHFGGLEGLHPVTSLATALEAIDRIVRQGEGAPREALDSHYSKFVSIRQEYAALLAEDRDFQPARPVLTNPYSIPPIDSTDTDSIALIDDPVTGDLSNLFDACYEVMLQMLGHVFLHAGGSEAEAALMADTTVGLMAEIIGPLGRSMTARPAGRSHPGNNAGPGFRISRGASSPTHATAARIVFHERLTELAAYCRLIEANGGPSVLASVQSALLKYAALFE